MRTRGSSLSLRRPLSILVGCLLAVVSAASADAASQRSSPIAISNSGAFLATVNAEVNTVTIFTKLDKKKPSKVAEVGVGREPASIAIHPDDTRVFVANSFDGTVSVVDIAAKAVVQTYPVGVEPSAIVLSPNGTRLYVANASSNDLSVVDTGTQTVIDTVDLAPFGTAPRALAVTDDGDADDTDETVFAALFFGQLRPGKSAVDEMQDDQREGRVVAISAATNAVLGGPNPIILAPLANTGFNSNGRLAPGNALVPAVASTNPQTFTTATGAFPNQLASLAIHPTNGKAYVLSTGASPNGPFRFNSNTQGLVSLFDVATRLEVTAAQTDPSSRRTAPLNLNQGINLDTALEPRIFMSNPVSVAWRPNGSDAWIAIQNSDVVVRLTVDAGGIPTIGAPLVAGPGTITRIDLRDQKKPKTLSNVPRGVAISPDGNKLFIANFISRDVTVVDITDGAAPAILASVLATKLPKKKTVEAESHLGASLFFTGRGPDTRMSSESWGGCVVCHPSGRSDNVTWAFDAGPRQTIPLDGMFSRVNRNDQRILNWSAVRDENQDFELNTRGVFGGRGLIEDDRLFFIFGGASGAEPEDSKLIEQFNQFTGTATVTNDLLGGKKKLPKLKGARRDFGVATLADGSVVIVGGRSDEGNGELVEGGNAVLRFNPRTNKITKAGNGGFVPRHSLGVGIVQTAAGERLYAIGGYGSTDPGAAPLDLVQELDPVTGLWRAVASLPTAVAQFGITVAGGVNTAEPLQLIHVVAGNTGSETSPNLTNPNPVQRFQADPAGPGTWSAFNPAGLTLRRNHGAATALRGVQSRVFVIGGDDAAGTVLSSVEEYLAQAVTGVLTPHTDLPAPRARFGIASTVTTNQIYVFGGSDGAGADQATILEYTVANNGPVAGPTGTPSGTWVTRANFTAKQGLAAASPRGVTNFLVHASAGRDARQDAIETWIARQVRAARAPVAAADSAALAGRTLFGTTGLVVPGFSCASCHGAEKWTRSLVDYSAPPSPEIGLGLGNERVIGAELRQTAAQGNTVLTNVGTFLANAPAGRTNEIRFNGADISQAIAPLGANGFNIPSLLSVHETAPYYYNGLAQTLEEVLNGSQDGNGGTRHHFVTSASDRADLIAFLRSIDDSTPIFP